MNVEFGFDVIAKMKETGYVPEYLERKLYMPGFHFKGMLDGKDEFAEYFQITVPTMCPNCGALLNELNECLKWILGELEDKYRFMERYEEANLVSKIGPSTVKTNPIIKNKYGCLVGKDMITGELLEYPAFNLSFKCTCGGWQLTEIDSYMNNLGLKYLNSGDLDEAYMLFRMATGMGCMNAQYNIAMMHLNDFIPDREAGCRMLVDLFLDKREKYRPDPGYVYLTGRETVFDEIVNVAPLNKRKRIRRLLDKCADSCREAYSEIPFEVPQYHFVYEVTQEDIIDELKREKTDYELEDDILYYEELLDLEKKMSDGSKKSMDFIRSISKKLADLKSQLSHSEGQMVEQNEQAS